MADVKWTFFADTAAAERAIQRLEQQNAKLENSLAQVSKKSRAANKDLIADYSKHTALIGAMKGAADAFAESLREAEKAQRDLFKAASDFENKHDVQTRKLRILGGLDAAGGEAARARIQGIAARFGFSSDEGMEGAKELTSAGFDVGQATSDALESLLKSLAANQEFGKNIDVGSLAKSTATYLNSQGQALTGQNLERIGVYIKKLADVSTVALDDVQELAKHGAPLMGKVTQEEQFAAMTHLISRGRPGSEAANSLEKVVLSLTGKGDKKKTAEALEELKLTPQDVDMIGEGFQDVLAKLRTGLEGIDPSRRDTLLTKLFGVEHISAASQLIMGNENVAKLTAGQNDRAGFNNAWQVATEGPAARGRRLELLDEQLTATKAGEWSDEDVKKAIKFVGMKGGMTPYGVQHAQEWYDASRGYGRTPREALGAEGPYIGLPGIYQGEMQQKIIALLDQTAKSAAEQTELLKQMTTTEQKKQPQLKRNTQGEGAP